jgi:hypothetical protein
MTSKISLKLALLCFLTITVALGIFCIVKQSDISRLEQENRARENMRKQIADYQDGRMIAISNETEYQACGMDEFVKSKNAFRPSDNFSLYIDYSHDIDDLLKQIAGTRGIRKIGVVQSGLTDVGLAHLASMPDLEVLSLTGGGITDKGLNQLRSSTKLETLFICPPAAAAITIPMILSLPHLRKLTLQDPEEGGWLAARFHQLEQAHLLKELILASDEISSEEIETLRTQLPNCNIVKKPRSEYGK